MKYDSKVDACRVCGSQNVQALGFEQTYRVPSIDATKTIYYSCCLRCRSVFQSNPLSEEQLYAHYQNNTHFRDALLTADDKVVIRQQVRFLSNAGIQKGDKVLEIGPSRAHFLDALKEAVSVATYFEEWNESSMRQLQSQGHRAANADDNNFSAIVMLHVLEHVLDPRAYVKALSKRLCPQGVLYIEVPDHSTWTAETATDNIEHISYFTTAGLYLLLADAGFSIRSMESLYNPYYSTCHKRVCRLIAVASQAVDDFPRVAQRHFASLMESRRLAMATIISSALPLGIYGVGALTDLLIDKLPLDPGQVSGFFDGDPAKRMQLYRGQIVKSAADICESGIKVILITSSAEKAIRQDLQSAGYTYVIFGWDDLLDANKVKTVVSELQKYTIAEIS